MQQDFCSWVVTIIYLLIKKIAIISFKVNFFEQDNISKIYLFQLLKLGNVNILMSIFLK